MWPLRCPPRQTAMGGPGAARRRSPMTGNNNMTQWKSTFAAAVALGLVNVAVAEERVSIADKYKWNLAEIYPTENDWDNARQQIAAEFAKVGARKGTLGHSAADLYQALALRDAIGQQIARLDV